jgi:hypothetical protein
VEEPRELLQNEVYLSGIVDALNDLLRRVPPSHPAYPHLRAAAKAAEETWEEARDDLEDRLTE